MHVEVELAPEEVELFFEALKQIKKKVESHKTLYMDKDWIKHRLEEQEY